MPAIAVKFCGAPRRSYMNPGAKLPVIGTDICGLPRNGVESFGVSHGSIFGCCLKSVNHEHAPSARSGRSATTRRSIDAPLLRPGWWLALTTNLLGTVLLQHVHHLVDLVGGGFHPHAEVAAREARIVAD